MFTTICHYGSREAAIRDHCSAGTGVAVGPASSRVPRFVRDDRLLFVAALISVMPKLSRGYGVTLMFITICHPGSREAAIRDSLLRRYRRCGGSRIFARAALRAGGQFVCAPP